MSIGWGTKNNFKLPQPNKRKLNEVLGELILKEFYFNYFKENFILLVGFSAGKQSTSLKNKTIMQTTFIYTRNMNVAIL